MKVKITTDCRPFVNGAGQPNGATVEADDATAKALIKNGHAIKADKKAAK